MAIVEGQGFITPKPVKIVFSDEEAHHIRIVARDIATRKGYNEDNCFVGWLGEGAIGKYLLQQTGKRHLCNCVYLSGGDGGIDVSVAGLDVQIKTKHQSPFCIIPAIKNKKVIPYKCDILMFCNVLSDLGEAEQIIDILGWIGLSEAEKRGRLRHRVKMSFLGINTKYLYPMTRFVKQVEAEELLKA